MVDKNIRLAGPPEQVRIRHIVSLLQNYIVLDIGLSHTKCGLSKDAMPIHIVPTPLSMINHLRGNISNVRYQN